MTTTGRNAAGRVGILDGILCTGDFRGRAARAARAAMLGIGTLSAAAAGLAGLTGCGSDAGPQPLTADAFVRRPAREIADDLGGNPVDRPGQLVDSGVRPPAAPALPDRPGPAADADTVREIGPTVRAAVRSPAAEATRPSNAGNGGTVPAGTVTPPPPVSRPAADVAAAPPRPTTGPGTYVELGAVLMVVNGRPIFTDKVLTAIEPALAVEAKKRNESNFRELAAALIENQIRLYKRDELEYATAERTLDAQDKALARAITIQWRQKKITEAGGSLELAKRKAIDEQGIDFDEMVERQNRLHLIQIFYQKRVIPLIQVAAADIRDYYNTHKDTEFTTHGSAKFRVIKVEFGRYAGRKDEALTKADRIQKQAAAAPASFASLAGDRNVNDDALLAGNGGYVLKDGWVDQGAYRVTAVDKAVFQMRPGQVSDLIQTDTAFYIVNVEELKAGGVQPFDDLQVQDRIREKLRAEQFAGLRDKHVADLEKNASTDRKDDAIRGAMNIVMRRYGQWASAQ